MDQRTTIFGALPTICVAWTDASFDKQSDYIGCGAIIQYPSDPNPVAFSRDFLSEGIATSAVAEFTAIAAVLMFVGDIPIHVYTDAKGIIRNIDGIRNGGFNEPQNSMFPEHLKDVVRLQNTFTASAVTRKSAGIWMADRLASHARSGNPFFAQRYARIQNMVLHMDLRST